MKEKQKKINKSRYAILGMLFEKPLSGYQIKQKMQNYTTHFWQESDASIYPMLKKLEEEGKVASRSEYVGKRERKIFSTTRSGKNEFTKWFQMPAEPQKPRSELLLRLYFSANAKNKEHVITQLKEALEKNLVQKERYKRIKKDVLAGIPDEHPHKMFWLMALKSGIIHNNANRKWLQECIQILENK